MRVNKKKKKKEKKEKKEKEKLLLKFYVYYMAYPWRVFFYVSESAPEGFSDR